jgi:hypothetical protein
VPITRPFCTVLLVSLVAAAPLAGQLGDALKKTDENRSAGTGRPFTARDLVGGPEWIITREGLEEYVATRTDIAAARRKSTTVHQRLFEASRRVNALADLSKAMSAESAIVQVLSQHGLTSTEYLRREQALVNARAWAAEKRLPDNLKSRPIRMQNVEFVRSNDKLIRDMTARYQKFETSAAPWFEPARFVQKP